MVKKRLSRSFFVRPTLKVAKELLGKFLVRKIGNPEGKPSASYGAGKKLVGKIVETEAYIGPEDKASHSFGGKITKRCKTEYLVGGHIYIYLCYGMYWQLNITTNLTGKPECVLVRALEPIEGVERIRNYDLGVKNLANGPGKLCRWLKLDKSFDGEDLTKSKRIWLAASPKGREDRGEKIKKSQIVATKRIGIEYAGIWAKKPWRFYIKNNQFVSGK